MSEEGVSRPLIGPCVVPLWYGAFKVSVVHAHCKPELGRVRSMRKERQAPWLMGRGCHISSDQPCVRELERTQINTSPYGTEASSAGRSGRACVARAVSVERGGMGERGYAGAWLSGCWCEANSP